MRGREEGAGRAAMPAWLQQGRDVCLPARSDGNALLAAPRQPASKGRWGQAPAPLGLSAFYSNSLLKVICASLATPHARKGFAAQQLAPSRTG